MESPVIKFRSSHSLPASAYRTHQAWWMRRHGPSQSEEIYRLARSATSTWQEDFVSQIYMFRSVQQPFQHNWARGRKKCDNWRPSRGILFL